MSPIKECILNKKTKTKPIWLMRQAGRYLPEFREIRKVNPNFINLCLNENLSTEITLQPIERFQFDAAINSTISKRKKSVLNGAANVFIFPDLDSANIAYKITEHLAGFQALGPLIQGLSKPVHDLSRGCKVDDIISIAAIAALQKNI